MVWQATHKGKATLSPHETAVADCIARHCKRQHARLIAGWEMNGGTPARARFEYLKRLWWHAAVGVALTFVGALIVCK